MKQIMYIVYVIICKYKTIPYYLLPYYILRLNTFKGTYKNFNPTTFCEK